MSMNYSYMLKTLEKKIDIDYAIKNTRDKVLCLVFIRPNNSSCLKLIDTVSSK